MEELTKCVHCKGRGHCIRWILREQITDPMFIRETCQRCHGTGRVTTLLQTAPRNLFTTSQTAWRLPYSNNAKA